MASPERDFQDAVVEYARLNGWIAAHFRTSRTGSGRHATAVAYDAAGFPDLVLVRDRIVYAEMKSPRGTLSDDQVAWSAYLQAAGAEWYCWKPRDWDDIVAVLSRVPVNRR